MDFVRHDGRVLVPATAAVGKTRVFIGEGGRAGPDASHRSRHYDGQGTTRDGKSWTGRSRSTTDRPFDWDHDNICDFRIITHYIIITPLFLESTRFRLYRAAQVDYMSTNSTHAS
mgnify:FL=1